MKTVLTWATLVTCILLTATANAGSPAARMGDLAVCPLATPGTPPIPHIGGPIIHPVIATVLIAGMPAATVGSLIAEVGPPAAIAIGSSTVFIGGMPAARLGDLTSHGGVVVIGAPTVLIGD